MKLAVISDIHSNVYALEAVLDDISKRGADCIINLGDTLYGPMAPKATYDLLVSHDIISICGNQDRMLFQVASDEYVANSTLRFVLNDLGDTPVEWLKTLPFDYQISNDIYACHGSPTNDLTYLLEDVSSGIVRVRADDEIVRMLSGQDSSVILCGHTHIPRVVELSSGQLVVNAGSVGLPAYTDDQPVVHSMETFSSHASYAILEASYAGWNVQQVKVAYEVQDAVAAAVKQGRFDWVHYLATGRGDDV